MLGLVFNVEHIRARTNPQRSATIWAVKLRRVAFSAKEKSSLQLLI